MKKSLFLIGILFLAKIACADIESGMYINPTIGYAIKSNLTGKAPTDNFNYSLGVFAGYAFDEYFSVDGNFTYLPNKSNDEFNNYYMTAIAARGSIWLSSFFSAYLRMGGGLLSNGSQNLNTNGGLFLGIGGLFELAPEMAITIDNYGIILPAAPADNFSIVSIGFSYGF